MRRPLQTLKQRIRMRPIDIAALIVVLVYGVLALSAQLGTSVAGQGLDPVWAAARQRGRLRVAVDIGFYPFSGIANNQPVGYDIDLARAIAGRLGLGVQFVPSSVEAIYETLDSDQADMGVSALPYAPDQGWRVDFSTFYFNAGQVLVVPVGSPIRGLRQLHGRRLGVPLGSDADTFARKLVLGDASIQLMPDYDTPAEVLADLRRGRLDAAIVDNAAALSDIGHYSGLRLLIALTLEPYVIATPSRAYELHKRINQALKDLQNQGFFEQNGKKWFVDAPLPTPRPRYMPAT